MEGNPDPTTGMIVDLVELDKRVQARVIDRYDHKHLNSDVPELSNVIPTSENVALKIFEQLDGELPARLSRVNLFETARSSFEVSADS